MKYKNNPFNIRSGSSWLGLSGTKNGFCEFSDLKYGIRAAAYLLLRSYRKRGIDQLYTILNRFAPASENNTIDYVYFVSGKTGINKFKKLVYYCDYINILIAMAYFESHTKLTYKEILNVIDEFKLKLY